VVHSENLRSFNAKFPIYVKQGYDLRFMEYTKMTNSANEQYEGGKTQVFLSMEKLIFLVDSKITFKCNDNINILKLGSGSDQNMDITEEQQIEMKASEHIKLNDACPIYFDSLTDITLEKLNDYPKGQRLTISKDAVM
jgi:hypothetical protein